MTGDKPGSGVQGRGPALQSEHSMDAWQKWTAAVNLGAQHAGRGYNAGVDLESDFLGVSRTPKLENLGVRQKIWESATFLKYNIIYS